MIQDGCYRKQLQITFSVRSSGSNLGAWRRRFYGGSFILVQPRYFGRVLTFIGEHNALDSVSERSKPPIEVSVNVFASLREELPTSMLKLNLQLVEQSPALTHVSHLKSSSGDCNQQTEHYGCDLCSSLRCTVTSGSQSHQRGDDRRAAHDQPTAKVERLLCSSTYNVCHQYALSPLGAHVFLSLGMPGELIG
jgi:hypothetical protein